MTEVTSPDDVFASLLERLTTDVSTHYGIPSVYLKRLESYDRPFSHVLRVGVHVDTSAPALALLFAKVLKPKDIPGGRAAMEARVRRDFDAMQRALGVLSSHPDLGVVPPIACYPDLLAIVTEEVAGETLLEHLEREAAWFPGSSRLEMLDRTLHSVGRWIRVFQTTEEDDGALAPADLRAYIDVRLRALVERSGGRVDESFRQQLLSYIDGLCDLIPASDLRKVPVHADLALGNVIVADDRVVVLDFAMAQLGTRLHDLTRIYLQIDQLAAKPHIRGAVTSRLQNSLLDGYESRAISDSPLFRTLVLLHRVNSLATLILGKASLASSLYNRRLERLHRAWIDAELMRQRTAPARP